MKKLRVLLAGLTLWGLTSVPAHAGVVFSLMGSADNSLFNPFGTTLSIGSNLGIGAGAGLEFKFGNILGIEGDFIYTRRNMAGFIMLNYADIPVVLRLHLGRILSIGVGAAYEMPMDTIASQFYVGTADLQINLPLGTKAAFFIRPRFSYDLTNTGIMQQNFLSGIAGFQFGGL